MEETARTLFDAGKPELARKYLTYYSNTEAMHGLQLAESLAQSLEARTKVIFGIRGEKQEVGRHWDGGLGR